MFNLYFSPEECKISGTKTSDMDLGGEKEGRDKLWTSCSTPDMHIWGRWGSRGIWVAGWWEIRHGMEELARLTLTLEGNRDHVKCVIGCARDIWLKYGSLAKSANQSVCCHHPPAPCSPGTAQPAENNSLSFFCFAKQVILCWFNSPSWLTKDKCQCKGEHGMPSPLWWFGLNFLGSF